MARTVPIFVAVGDREYLWGWSHDIEDGTGVKVCPDHFISVLVDQLKRQRQQGKLLNVLSELERAVVKAAVREEASFHLTKRIWKETSDGWVRVGPKKPQVEPAEDKGPSRYEVACRVRASLEGRKRAQEACHGTSRRAHGGIAETGKMRVVVGKPKKRRVA